MLIEAGADTEAADNFGNKPELDWIHARSGGRNRKFSGQSDLRPSRSLRI